MVTFKKNDHILHPMYGKGEILKVTAVNDKRSTLEVSFPEKGITKELNSLWVEANCTHLPYQKTAKPQFRDGIYREDPSLRTENFKIFPEENTEVSARQLQGLQYILSHVTPGIHLVQIERYAVVVLSPEEAQTDRQMEKAARVFMNRALNRHPDFGCIQLPDGGVVITMCDDHLWQFIPPAQVKRKASGEISLETMLCGRQALMDACSEKTMYAMIRSAAE